MSRRRRGVKLKAIQSQSTIFATATTAPSSTIPAVGKPAPWMSPGFRAWTSLLLTGALPGSRTPSLASRSTVRSRLPCPLRLARKSVNRIPPAYQLSQGRGRLSFSYQGFPAIGPSRLSRLPPERKYAAQPTGVVQRGHRQLHHQCRAARETSRARRPPLGLAHFAQRQVG